MAKRRKKRAITVENDKWNRNKKGYNKNIKIFNEYSTLAENPYNSGFSDIEKKVIPIIKKYKKIYSNNKSNNVSD